MALKVIGAGLGRTGTLSLKLALEKLGFGPCYHMTEVLSQARTRLPHWLDVVAGKPDWDTLFAGFSATVDYPACTFWRELAAHYPDAKVILSDRDAAAWYQSATQTILRPENIERISEGPMGAFMHGVITAPFTGRLRDRDFMLDFFDRWRADVIAGLPPERLLVHRSADGWEPLCAFLGVPVPAEPYPRVNSKEDMRHGIQDGDATADPSQANPDPAAMEARMASYLESMNRLAWG
ncbi:MAG: hypothetical protein KGN34_11605 [Sphingomonadales bacterium]|nr:hypothetical protein [Sphingomonadales bacterium]